MKHNLMIIESPNKVNTLKKYLGQNFKILATVGHIRELANRNLGFDENYTPIWSVPRKKKIKEKSKREIVNEIKKEAKKAKNIYLASDPDREGEAIAWHVFEVLENKENQDKCKRVTFNEISQTAVENSLKNPHDINMKLVNSQLARTLLDRMIGFRLSRIVQNSLQAESAGRVQSVALKFLQEREKEIENFQEEKWWTVDVTLNNGTPLTLYQLDNTQLNSEAKGFTQSTETSVINFKNEILAQKVKKSLQNKFTVVGISEPKFSLMNPKECYRTSTLQQDGINKLSWTSKKIALIAQKLYEGLEIDGDYIALITYPRTDSTRIAEAFHTQAREFILAKFGQNYLGQNYHGKISKNKELRIQDAHEAIRPIYINLTPDSIRGKIDESCYALYKMIWTRTVANFMAAATFCRTIVYFTNNNFKFAAINRERTFDGYQKIYEENQNPKSVESIPLKEFCTNKVFKAKDIEIKEHKTLPMPRFSQASLIDALEKAGIGRPSTYSMMANIVLDRGYAELKNRAYVLTELGKKVAVELEKYFPEIINKDFTKQMENNLDLIADGTKQYKEYLDHFWPDFQKKTKSLYDTIAQKRKKEIENEKVGRQCPEDACELIYRYSRKTKKKFIGCINFPKCKYHEWLEIKNKPIELERVCPKCNAHKLVERLGRENKPFIACSGFPKCRYVEKLSQKARTTEKKNSSENIIQKENREKN